MELCVVVEHSAACTPSHTVQYASWLLMVVVVLWM